MYDFGKQLEISKGFRHSTDRATILALLDGADSVVSASETQDRKGIDYIATLRKGATVFIDIKSRERGCSRYWRQGEPEVAIEKWSVVPSGDQYGKAGWTLDESKETDMILYVYHPDDTNQCFLLPFHPLRMAAKRNIIDWESRFKVDVQRSNGWKSQAVFVPFSVVSDAIRKTFTGELVVDFNENQGQQVMEFEP